MPPGSQTLVHALDRLPPPGDQLPPENPSGGLFDLSRPLDPRSRVHIPAFCPPDRLAKKITRFINLRKLRI